MMYSTVLPLAAGRQEGQGRGQEGELLLGAEAGHQPAEACHPAAISIVEHAYGFKQHMRHGRTQATARVQKPPPVPGISRPCPSPSHPPDAPANVFSCTAPRNFCSCPSRWMTSLPATIATCKQAGTGQQMSRDAQRGIASGGRHG